MGKIEPDNGSSSIVLIVDDDRRIRKALAALLESKGLTVLEAEDATGALSTLESDYDIHILFTDIQMPGAIDGLKLARQAKTQWPHLHIVITSGAVVPLKSDLPDGAIFLRKPYGAGVLMDCLRQVGADLIR